MKASDAIAKVLSANNVTIGFELIGGMIAHLVDSIYVLNETKLISLHHEQSAAFAAGGVARATNNRELGLALGTSGPGATNLVTGIADCWLDSYPCVFITGQVNTYELKGSRGIRQQGFQELDIVSVVKSITKYAVQIETADTIISELQKAIDIATSGRPGPVLIDIPMDLQRADLRTDVLDYLESRETNKVSSFEFCEESGVILQQVFESISEASKPIFVIGGGGVNEPSFGKWQSLLSENNIPHVSSLKGSEKTLALDGYFGMIGAYGTRVANYAVQNADVVIVLGSRLDVRQTGADVGDFARNAKKIIQIDIDSEQLGNRVKGHINLNITCEEFYLKCIEKNVLSNSYASWSNDLNALWQEKFINEYAELPISPFNLCLTLSKLFEEKLVHFVTDVGNNQMWVAHSLMPKGSQMVHHSGGLGAMGFAIPTSIGVHYAKNCSVVSISGDGGAQLNIQELDVIARENLPILTIVINNASLGMVRAFQEMYFDGRNQSTYWEGYSSSFVGIGKAYNMKSILISSELQFENAVSDFIESPKPMLLEVVMIDANECKPRLTFGNSIDKQFPYGDHE